MTDDMDDMDGLDPVLEDKAYGLAVALADERDVKTWMPNVWSEMAAMEKEIVSRMHADFPGDMDEPARRGVASRGVWKALEEKDAADSLVASADRG